MTTVTNNPETAAAPRQSDETYRRLIDMTRTGFLLLDHQGRVLDANDEYVRLAGRHSLGEILGRSVLEWTAAASREKNTAAVVQCCREGYVKGLQLDYVDAAGRITPVEIDATVEGTGASLRILSLCRDVTERRQHEDLLCRQETQFRLFVENAPVAIAMFDTDMRYLAASNRWLTDYGLSGQRLVGRCHYDVFPEIPERWKAIHRRCLAGAVERAEADDFQRADGSVQWLRWEIQPWWRSAGVVGGIILYSEDVTAHQLTAAALRQKTALFEAQVNSSLDGILIVDNHGRKVLQNQRTAELWQIPQHILDDRDDVTQIQHVMHMTKYPERFAARVTYLYQHPDEIDRDEVELINGTVLDRYSAPVLGKDGRNYGRIWTFRDITRRKQAELTLRQSEEKFKSMTDASPLAVSVYRGVHGPFEYLNRKFLDLFGYTLDDMSSVAAWYVLAYPDEKYREFLVEEWEQRAIHAITTKSAIEPMESTVTCKDGSTKTILWGLVSTGEINIAYGLDVTQRKRADEMIAASLREKQALLKEIHHRVKNNLQIIVSLLRLQAGQIDHPGTRAALRDMQSRVRAMALIHEHLYRSDNLAQVDLAAYLRTLSQQLFRALTVEPGAIRLHLDMRAVCLSIDQAIPCGLLANELVSNALKHAFPGGRAGELRLELHPLAGGPEWCLRVADDGVGLPTDFDLASLKSLGLSLVPELARQMRGRLEIGPGPGAAFAIIFTPT